MIDTTTETDTPTWFENWGHFYWMAGIILMEMSVVLSALPAIHPVWYGAIGLFLVLTEVTQFYDHVMHSHKEHPWYSKTIRDARPWLALVGVWLFLLIFFLFVDDVLWEAKNAPGLTFSLAGGQICASATVHWNQHGESIWSSGRRIAFVGISVAICGTGLALYW